MSTAKKIDLGHPFMDSSVILNLANGINTTLKTMTDLVATFDKPFVGENWKSPTEFSVILELSVDPFKGILLFHFDKTVAQSIIEKLTGSAIDSVNNTEILDGIGEVSNMFYGTAKTKLNEIGFKLKMSVPKPLVTSELPAPVGDFKNMIIPFKILNKSCFVEIVVYLNESTAP
jgi:chemotaxis protein CheX